MPVVDTAKGLSMKSPIRIHVSLLPLCLALFLAPLTLRALTQGDYTYTTITSFNHTYSGALSITNTLSGCTVNQIWSGGFMHCDKLTHVAVPASVTYIAPQAFTRCPSLAAITVDAENPAYSSVDGVLFSKDHTAVIKFPGAKTGDYTIPAGTTNIGYWAFKSCNNLTSVTVPASVTSNGAMEVMGKCCRVIQAK